MNERTWRVGRALSDAFSEPALTGPDWAQASPQRIRRSLKRALALPSGGWYAVSASRELKEGPQQLRVAGRNLVAWRDAGHVRVGFDECPHLGASLSGGRVCQGKVVCPWHDLALGTKRHGAWQALPVHDDGVLTWVRMDSMFKAEELSAAPYLSVRPARYLEAVVQLEVACEPRDVLANRLDPWHGAHFHPYSFAKLRVTHATDELLRLRVQYRLLGPVVVEVDATFHCPNPRSIVMTIVDGEGEGSVVETHATPLGPGRTMILEATLASSERAGFRYARAWQRALRPLMRRVAHRLWVDDAAYAERLYALRTGALETSSRVDVPSDLHDVGGERPRPETPSAAE